MQIQWVVGDDLMSVSSPLLLWLLLQNYQWKMYIVNNPNVSAVLNGTFNTLTLGTHLWTIRYTLYWSGPGEGSHNNCWEHYFHTELAWLTAFANRSLTYNQPLLIGSFSLSISPHFIDIEMTWSAVTVWRTRSACSHSPPVSLMRNQSYN